jgi:molybdopterin molybdotransferase
MQEDVTRDGETITLATQPEPGQHIRTAGNDFAAGTPLIGKGSRLTPAALALAAAAGHAELPVVRRPRLALLATGDELVPPGTVPGPDQIVASNGAGLRAMFSPFVSAIEDYGIVRDNEPDLREALSAALASDADVIVTTGGASVGDKDLVRPMLGDLGVSLDLWRIAMRPGKPLMFARAGGKLIFGLPGNPVSALTTAFLLVVPALRAIAGDADPGPHYLTLPLATPLEANGPRRHFRRAQLLHTPEGTQVTPIEMTDSAHLSSFASADALIVQMENSEAAPEGTFVQVLFLAP